MQPPGLPATEIRPEDITIAVTVFSRREYLERSIGSALAQTRPVRVMVVEDCGPDEGLRRHVEERFGSAITYHRNPRRRGIFGNWNACLDLCPTPWLSILHDDDWLAPGFVEEMVRLSAREPGCGLYYGHTIVTGDDDGRPMENLTLAPCEPPSRRQGVEDMLWITPFPFPGHLFHVAAAKRLGGFREGSLYCGDWEMWVNLADAAGAAQGPATVAFNRQHVGWDRGTSKVVREGRMYPLSYVQHKRILALLRARGRPRPFRRGDWLERYPMPTSFLLQFGAGLSERRLNYHLRLLALSPSPHWRHAVVKRLTGWLGPQFIRTASKLRNWRAGSKG